MLSRLGTNSAAGFAHGLNFLNNNPKALPRHIKEYEPELSPNRHKHSAKNRLSVALQGTTNKLQNIGHRGISLNDSTKYFHQIDNKKEYEVRKVKVPVQPINKWSLFCAAMVSINNSNKNDSKVPNANKNINFNQDPKFNFRKHQFSYTQLPKKYQKPRKFGIGFKNNKNSQSPFQKTKPLAALAQKSPIQKFDETPPTEEALFNRLPNISSLYTVACGISKSTKQNDPVSQKDCILTTNVSRNYGEDSCFVSETNCADIMGVCDGVGGWNNHGIDPSEFSGFLGKFLENFTHQNSFKVDQPVQLLSRAYNKLFTKPDLYGSATACVATFCRKTEKLYTANLGDSGWLVIRKGKVVARSKPMCHSFNAPFQLCKAPAKLLGRNYNDSPSQAKFQEFQCEQGDIIVIASDGMFDNIFEADLIMMLKRLNLGDPKSHFENDDSGNESDDDKNNQTQFLGSKLISLISKGVQVLVEYTRIRANDRDYRSPFSKEAEKNNKYYSGGKVDDITILVSVVGPKKTQD